MKRNPNFTFDHGMKMLKMIGNLRQVCADNFDINAVSDQDSPQAHLHSDPRRLKFKAKSVISESPSKSKGQNNQSKTDDNSPIKVMTKSQRHQKYLLASMRKIVTIVYQMTNQFEYRFYFEITLAHLLMRIKNYAEAKTIYKKLKKEAGI